MFDEANMRQTLGKYVPNGETLLAGIHAVSKETNITGVFSKCVRGSDRLIPDENAGAIALSKRKHTAYDVYLGITQFSLIIVECEKTQYHYQLEDNLDETVAEIQKVDSDIFLSDIGTCFLLADIQSCELKKGWMGSVQCLLTMKNGSYFKLILPKLGGLGGGMPHHTEYREAIIARLREKTV